MKEKMKIISGADSIRYHADINHKEYAKKHNIDYEFFIRTDLSNPYMNKCYSIIETFNQGYDHVVWIDDDAFFINLNWDCTTIFKCYHEDIIVVRGRAKKNGTTLFNNGIMFIRNSTCTRELFTLIPQTPWKEVAENWKTEWGPCTGNDQPRMIYLTQTKYPHSVRILDYPNFNVHEIEFHKNLDFIKTNPPIVHITGQNKLSKIERFYKNTGIKLIKNS